MTEKERLARVLLQKRKEHEQQIAEINFHLGTILYADHSDPEVQYLLSKYQSGTDDMQQEDDLYEPYIKKQEQEVPVVVGLPIVQGGEKLYPAISRYVQANYVDHALYLLGKVTDPNRMEEQHRHLILLRSRYVRIMQDHIKGIEGPEIENGFIRVSESCLGFASVLVNVYGEGATNVPLSFSPMKYTESLMPSVKGSFHDGLELEAMEAMEAMEVNPREFISSIPVNESDFVKEEDVLSTYQVAYNTLR